MIAHVLEFIRIQLDAFLKTETGTEDSLVKFSGLRAAPGSASLIPDVGLTMTVVNIQNDSSLALHAPPIRFTEGSSRKAAPFYLDIYFLLSSSVDDDEYLRGLDLLSFAMTYFQNHPTFRMGGPADLEKLQVELTSIDMDRMNGLWMALGTAYKPSVIYKMRMLKMQGDG